MLGAAVSRQVVEFRVWAPKLRQLSVRINSGEAHPMSRNEHGIFSASLPAKAGDKYCYLAGDRCLPDPVSRYLPDGVHGPTQIVDPDAFSWTDEEWHGLAFHEYVIYELHVGTFSTEGTFDAVIDKLAYLRDLGVTAIEIMPVAAFPGHHNWGYDGVSLYAVQNSYGGPDGLKRLVNAAHRQGLAVMLDVVYNHVGSEGNYLREFGPYFTSRHSTPWGDGINYDDRDNEQVRSFVLENALYWVREYHIDGLRLDAVQTIKDDSRKHIVQEINEAVQEFARGAGRRICVTAESDENDRTLILPIEAGGFGLDATWTDDFHHAVHTFLTGENKGYYQDYGEPGKIVQALNEGYVFQGEYFKTWKRARGTSSEGIPLPRHIFCIQNHDQIGNRCWGERLGHLVGRGAAKAAAALLLLAPETPLLFMGEEYGESAPFQFFVDYGDPTLQKAVVEGRKKEFEEFGWTDTPNPQDPATFLQSKLTWTIDEEMLSWYRDLLRLRKEFVTHSSRTCKAQISGTELWLQVPAGGSNSLLLTISRGSAGPSSRVPDGEVLFANEDDDYRVVITRTASVQSAPALEAA